MMFPFTSEGSRALRKAIRAGLPMVNPIYFLSLDGGAICSPCVRAEYVDIARARREAAKGYIDYGACIVNAAPRGDLSESRPCEYCNDEQALSLHF